MQDHEPVSPKADDCQIEPNNPVKRNARFILDPESSPDAIRKRYLARAGQYFFRDRNNALAFEDKGARIATRNEDPVVAASMIELAIAKGWTDIKVSGSESFRRSVWLEAARRGLPLRGYQPKSQDELHLQEIMDRVPLNVKATDLGLSRSRAFTEQPREAALRLYPELEKAYEGKAAVDRWIDANIATPHKQSELRMAVARGIAERLAKGEIPTVVVLPKDSSIDPDRSNVIRKQAIVMGAVARVKGNSPEQVQIVIAAAERIGRHLADKGVWIPEPMVYDRNAPARMPSVRNDNNPAKPEIRRQPRIQPRR